MLSRVLIRLPYRFSSSITTSSTSETLNKIADAKGVRISQTQLRQISEIISQQQKHLASVVNDIKAELSERTAFNFEQEYNNETTVFVAEPGNNTYKLAELLTLGATGKLVSLLLGFPSYGALALVGGLAGAGAALSYSNYLKRSAAQITSISWTNNNQLHIQYLKPTSLLSSEASETVVERSKFSYVSFGCQWMNMLRKSKNTVWVRVDDQLFWYNGGAELRVNSHLFSKLL